MDVIMTWQQTSKITYLGGLALGCTFLATPIILDLIYDYERNFFTLYEIYIQNKITMHHALP